MRTAKNTAMRAAFLASGLVQRLHAIHQPRHIDHDVLKRCLATACFADTELKDDLVKKLRGVTQQGHFNFEDGNRRPISLPVSFKGFGEAFDAIAKE